MHDRSSYRTLLRRYRMAAAALVAVVAVAAVGWAVGRRNALPPRAIVMATGPEGGAYAAVAARYREALGRLGLQVELRPTQGDVENLALLRDPRSGVSVAFLQSGSTSEDESPGLVSLGTVFRQPVWIFQRNAARLPSPLDLQGKTVAAGAERSGTRAATLRLLRIAGTDPATVRFQPLTPAAAAEALLQGEVDAMIQVASWDAPVVRRLVADPRVSVASTPRADAFVALDPSLERLTLPRGVGNMALDRPPEDVTLLALQVSLVVPRDLHPAIQYLLLDAASDVHAPAGIFSRAGQFPAAAAGDLPLSADARHFYRSGRPFLQRYLPYWVAVLVERLLLVLIPIVGVLLPAVRFLPVLYNVLMEKRIVRLYGELKVLEAEMDAAAPGKMSVGDLAARLGELEQRADQLRVPARFSIMRYTLKQHIDMVRRRLRERHGGAADGEARRAGGPGGGG